MGLPDTFLQLVVALGASMTQPTLTSLVTVVQGWLFAGRRTLTGVLVAVGEGGTKHFSAYYRLFASARWRLDALGLALFGLLQPLLQNGPVPLTLDDTLARKRGLKVFGAGMHHDPLASSRKYAVTSWGHRWVVLAVPVQLPCIPGRFFSLPVLFRLYLNQKAAARWRRTHRTRPELAVALLHLLCSRFPEQRFHAYADSTYGGHSVLAYLPANCDLTSRLPLEARLHQPPLPRRPGTRGRPRKRGARLPSPRRMLQTQRARRVTLELYGRKDQVRLVEAVARWHGVPQRPLKVVVVEPLTGGRPVQALYSTDIAQSAEQVLTGYSGRWSIEESFRDIKDLRFGMGLPSMSIAEPERRDRLLLVGALAMALLTLLGEAGERLGMERYLKANTVKKRSYSLFRQGCFYSQALPMMPEAQLRPLMELFGQLVREQPVFREAFGVI